jgi:NTP pyrophosphatase (non-canonical NTP hydrolase)
MSNNTVAIMLRGLFTVANVKSIQWLDGTVENFDGGWDETGESVHAKWRAIAMLTEQAMRAALKPAQALNDFHRQNIARQHEAFAPAHSLMALVACCAEEVGELAGAVLGVTGEKKRKAHLTNADVLDAVADAITYLSLVAGAVGCLDLEKLLGDTFNMVSDRVGSSIKTTLGTNDNAPQTSAV